MPVMSNSQEPSDRPSLWKSVGPALIVACVVLGPGSIVANSTVGWKFGYEMVWVLVLAGLLMMGMTLLSARLGVQLEGTVCDELAARAGRPLASAAGITLFLVAACFQFSNNLGILYAIEPWMPATGPAGQSEIWSVLVLLVLNAGIIAALFGFRELYVPVERLMKLLVAVMVIGFAVNLFRARPSMWDTLFGLLPRMPRGLAGESTVGEDVMGLLGMVGTTFSVGGAFYHSYLVRQKGWSSKESAQGTFDSVVGIGLLGLMSLMIMVTAAAVLHQNPDVTQLKTAADVANQLRPMFGPFATALFCLGIFAGAFSSFLVNAMVGGTVLSDGLGLGASMDDRSTKVCTVFVLVLGLVVAVAIRWADVEIGKLIVFAQALTVLGNPLLAGALVWLAFQPDLRKRGAVPVWILVLAILGFLVVVGLSVRMALIVYANLQA